MVRDDPTVVQMKDALAAAGDVLIMGDDDEGASPPGRRRSRMAITSMAVAESRAPVGSSAKTIDGSITWDRAIATR